MENVRFGRLATEIARPHSKAWGLPEPGEWFEPSKHQQQAQSEDDMKSVIERQSDRPGGFKLIRSD